jgi:hypothetical protein
MGRAPGETPLEHADRLAARPALASPEPVRALARVATAAVYADPDTEPSDPSSVTGEARAARAALRPTVRRWRRVAPIVGWGWWRSPYRQR